VWFFEGHGCFVCVTSATGHVRVVVCVAPTMPRNAGAQPFKGEPAWQVKLHPCPTRPRPLALAARRSPPFKYRCVYARDRNRNLSLQFSTAPPGLREAAQRSACCWRRPDVPVGRAHRDHDHHFPGGGPHPEPDLAQPARMRHRVPAACTCTCTSENPQLGTGRPPLYENRETTPLSFIRIQPPLYETGATTPIWDWARPPLGF
jgi:hypothetical protein